MSRSLEKKINKINAVSILRKNIVIFPEGKVTINPFLYYIDDKYIIGDVFSGIDTKNAKIPKHISKKIIDFDVINFRNHICDKMADYIIARSKKNLRLRRYIDEALNRIFE